MPDCFFSSRYVLRQMTRERLKKFSEWFAGYLRPFETGDEEVRRNTLLKKEHTRRVRAEITGLGRELGLKKEELLLADTLTLFHDLGRFEQYSRYRTFVDRDSEDHAALGVKILKVNRVLAGLDEETRGLLLKAISYHNRISLPDKESPRCLFFTRLLRDADKLDIFKVVTDYYQRSEPARDRAIELGLPDTPGFSPDVYQALLRREIVRADRLRNLNDFKLLQVGWIYGLNFPPALARVRRRRYLAIIRAYLPRTEKIDRILKMSGDYLREKARSGKRFAYVQVLA